MKNLVEPIRNKTEIKKIENYLATRNQRNYLIFAFGLNTGLRISDILNLNVEDVQNKTFVEIREKKTNKYKKFPLNQKLQKLIKTYLKTRKTLYTIDNSNALFIGQKHKRLHRTQVYRFLKTACKAVGVSINVGTHTMRKSFGYHFYKQYNDIVLLQKILNHSHPAITLRYIGITQEEIDTCYKNFEL